MNHSQEVDGELLEAGREASALLQPADDALDDAAPAVGWPVEPGVRPLVRARRDHRANPSPPQILPDGRIAVALVAGQRLGPGPGTATTTRGEPNASEDRLDLLRLVRLSGRERGDERDAVAADQEVELGAEAAA